MDKIVNKDLRKISRELKKIKIKDVTNTFLEIIGRSRDEVLISKLIAFFLNPQNTSFKLLFEIIKNTKFEKDSVDFVQLISLPETKFESVNTEECIANDSRVDIVVKFSTFWVVIENKIDSGENNFQTLRYVKHLDNLDIPIKYICLKPNYNKCKFSSDKFYQLTYGNLAKILKKINRKDFLKKENYFYFKEFIRHIEVFFVNEEKINFNENVKFYLKHQDQLESIISDYNNQCEIIKNELTDRIIKEFKGTHMVSMKSGYLQVWKKEWEYNGDNSIHYEILGNFNKLIGKIKIDFAIHNERETKTIYAGIPHKKIYTQIYLFDKCDNIEESINSITKKIRVIADENDEKIHNELKK